jgi:hypothetical protein
VRSQLDTPFSFGARVLIDGDRSVVAVVTGFLWRSTICTIEVSWMNSGAVQTAWLEQWRLSEAEPAA